MKKITLFLMTVLFCGTILGQQTFKVNVTIYKSTPTFWLRGTPAIINFNNHLSLTESATALTFTGGQLKWDTDTLSTRAYARLHAGSGSGMVYPSAGIPLSTGIGWSTSITNNSTNWNTAYTDRLKWDGGATGLTAATGRTSLGATTVGNAIFTLTNPSAISYLKINADNSVTAQSIANTKVDLGVTAVETDLATYLNLEDQGSLKHPVLNPQTGATYTLVLADDNALVTRTYATACTLTIPLNNVVAFPYSASSYTVVHVANLGAGTLTINGSGGVTLISKGSALSLATGAGADLVKVAINTWWVVGGLQ